MRRGLLLCATRWCKKEKNGRGRIEQCVGDFCSLPRGGVKEKKKEKMGRGSIEWCVGKFRPVPLGGVKEKKKKRSGTVCATSFGFCSFLLCPTR